MPWYVYLLECRDGSIYTGIATDVERRYREHAAGKGARYTRAFPPQRLLGSFPYPDRSSASRAGSTSERARASVTRSLRYALAELDGVPILRMRRRKA